ncbi:winged helix DNA-binding domain-containing protein [Paenibacillus sp. MMS18-CY102]|uniref:winged helix DNA-binding domain-containing protein n=1 Tax=Paenibacillus sp. MMS18-CY102 TaxID=2682849 RepID=UPI0013662649|nr:winged helix DNA-binding domain-containing protein [Paenibacillus sp. MMS18-CY102]MWC27120.1 winged helix DNA-binding domain-containing protein [Paenibacillus sp. MMS18-CY102]
MRTDRTKASMDSGAAESAVMGTRALNRALLARQMLLHRVKLSPLEAIEQLVGLQAQSPHAPYYALWARLEAFRPEELSLLIENRSAVRLALMRSTLHLVSAKDCLELRPWGQTVHERGLQGAFGKRLAGLDLQEVAAVARELVEDEPQTLAALGKRLQLRWPDRDPAALSAAVRASLPLVQMPPRGLWGMSGQAVHTTAEAWLGEPLAACPDAHAIVQRYLAAFGPASVKDIQAWSGLTRMADAVNALRPQLITFRDEQGCELFDLPDAPRPAANGEVPIRFLGEFDNMLLSYADRSRIMDEAYRKRVITDNGIVRSTVLIGGFVGGLWRIERGKQKATLVIELFKPLSEQETIELVEEGQRLLSFAVPDAGQRELVIEG